MAWAYSSAVFNGSKSDPQPGHSVTVLLQEDSDPEDVQEREFTYTFDGSKTKGQFVAMVKQEVKAHLVHLNGGLAEGDATSEFEPS